MYYKISTLITAKKLINSTVLYIIYIGPTRDMLRYFRELNIYHGVLYKTYIDDSFNTGTYSISGNIFIWFLRGHQFGYEYKNARTHIGMSTFITVRDEPTNCFSWNYLFYFYLRSDHFVPRFIHIHKYRN